jgi:hypothetical protein
MNERRRHSRFHTDIPAQLRILSPHGAPAEEAGKLSNLSPTGACITTPRALQPTDVIEMLFCLPEQSAPLKAYAEMVWSHSITDSMQRVGLHFLAIRDSDLVAIGKHQEKHYTKPGFMVHN